MLKQRAERKDLLRALGEVFRAHGYEGASLALITEATPLAHRLLSDKGGA